MEAQDKPSGSICRLNSKKLLLMREQRTSSMLDWRRSLMKESMSSMARPDKDSCWTQTSEAELLQEKLKVWTPKLQWSMLSWKSLSTQRRRLPRPRRTRRPRPRKVDLSSKRLQLKRERLLLPKEEQRLQPKKLLLKLKKLLELLKTERSRLLRTKTKNLKVAKKEMLLKLRKLVPTKRKLLSTKRRTKILRTKSHLANPRQRVVLLRKMLKLRNPADQENHHPKEAPKRVNPQLRSIENLRELKNEIHE